MKKTIALLIALAMVPIIKADVWRDPGTGIVWTYTSFGGKEAAIGDGLNAAIPTDTAGELTLPSEINGLPVTGIENEAFAGCSNLTRVVIPNSVTNIGVLSWNFWNLGYDANDRFYYEDRTYGVEGEYPNYHWTAEASARLPNLAWEVAYSSSGSSYPKLVIASFSCRLTEEEIAYLDFLASKYCFSSYGVWCTTLQCVVSDAAFGGCGKITSVSLPSGNALAQVFPDAYDKITNVVISKCSHSSVMLLDMQFFNQPLIEGGAIAGLSGLCSLKEVSLPTDAVIISGNAFANCSRLESIIIPPGVKVIGASAFYGCSSLKKVIVPEGAVGIERLAFGNCLSLADVAIPDSVTYLASGTGGVTNMSNCAFLGCESIRRVSLPSRYALRDVFPDSYDKIQTVVFSDALSTVGASMLKGCEALESIVIPASVTSIDSGAFAKLSKLKNVTFLGDAPDFGEDVFYGTPRKLTLTVPEDSLGWTDYELWGVPPPWGGRSVVGGTGGETDGGGSGEPDPGSSAPVSVVVVSNVVVHYVMNSVMSPMAAPVTEDVGIVNVMTEIKGGNVAIPDSWAGNYPTFAQKFGTSFAAALTQPSGKTDAAGNPMLVWQDYVAGTDPTDEDDVFRASVTIVDGKPVVSYTPELTEAEKAKRVYRTYGKVRLGDDGWTLVPEGREADYNFFKVTVELK